MNNQVAQVSKKELAAAEPMVPAGYKQTEVGVIPEDWEVSNLQDVASFGGGTTPARKFYERYFASGKYPWVKTLDLNNSFIWSTEESVTEAALQETSLKKYSSGTVLVAMYGGFNQIGRTGLIKVDAAINQALVAILPIQGKLVAEYLLYDLNFNVDYWKNVASSSRKDPNITSNDVKSYCLQLPRVEEQIAIANALTDMDALIGSLEALITKKQAIKTATMQQLLTGRTRLPQFARNPDGSQKGYKTSELGEIPEGWEVIEIGQFAPLQRGFDLPSTIRKDGKYPVVYSNGIVNTHCEYQVKGPGVVTGRSGTLGKVHFVDSDYWPHNTSLWVTKFNKAEPGFVYFLFTYIGFERFASGSGVPTLNRNDAHCFKVALPFIEEQTAIAAILSDMDEEIQALEARLTKTRDLKQGMMQQLLTGKIRLVKPLARGEHHAG